MLIDSAQPVGRLRIVIRGAVQGVGFRPFVYRLAREFELSGWVINSAQGVFIEAEGSIERLKHFLQRIRSDAPPRSYIQSCESAFLDPVGFERFEIRTSEAGGEKTVLILPDIATCPDCLSDICDPDNRRYRYPFTNCTHCGPRYTIIESLPYDRGNTTMRRFAMCADCAREYNDPMDRRFHAQPNACPVCGPQLELWDPQEGVIERRDAALTHAAEAIRNKQIVAVKGLGGFHLLVLARDEQAVVRLRERKHRDEKPLALMCPSLESVRTLCNINPEEEQLLLAPEAPIVLLRRSGMNAVLSDSVAPHNPYYGVMLPYSPLHVLLMQEIGEPIVATSGNHSDEPICIESKEAVDRLSGIADLFLVHDRPIARHVDDSVVQVIQNRQQVLRRARGYAPLPITLAEPLPSMLATGAHIKSALSVVAGRNVFLSQHIGDLGTLETYQAFERTSRDLLSIYEIEPEIVACDMHPDYPASQFARAMNRPCFEIQHHHAHVVSCMAENDLEGDVLGVCWDGTGYGPDGTIWGGEFLKSNVKEFTRAAHLRTFCLPGGDHAVKQTHRIALGLLYELYGADLWDMEHLLPVQFATTNERNVLDGMLQRQFQSPRTSSMGRLFDAVASIIGLRQSVRFEGQAAMELEFAVSAEQSNESYPLMFYNEPSGIVVDWQPMIRSILSDVQNSVAVGCIANRFHQTLVDIILQIARRVGLTRVVLSGGCFQNRVLTERAVSALHLAGRSAYIHQRVPPNDGGIALGQSVVAAARWKERSSCA